MLPVPCRHCGGAVHPAAPVCPQCGTRLHGSARSGLRTGLIALIALLLGVVLTFLFMTHRSGQEEKGDQKLVTEYFALDALVKRDEKRLRDLRFLDAVSNQPPDAVQAVERERDQARGRMQQIVRQFGPEKASVLLHSR